MSLYHTPVMIEESINLLQIVPGNYYIDCNLGGGGHAKAILDKGGKVIGLDIDSDAINEVSTIYSLPQQQNNPFKTYSNNQLTIIQANFSKIDQVYSSIQQTLQKQIKISGILYDLGLSAHQLESPNRGFSFTAEDSTLDMRMDQSLSVTAKDLLNALSEKELAILFTKLGEENFAKPIARKIVEQRKINPILTTGQLNTIIFKNKSHHDHIHPSTRIFQALRIAVNDELNSLKDSLPLSFEILSLNSRLVIISFHSLEDRIAKDFFTKMSDLGQAKIITKKPLTPTDQEIAINPKSRSAKLRCLEKTSSPHL